MNRTKTKEKGGRATQEKLCGNFNLTKYIKVSLGITQIIVKFFGCT
jgi:hypothetical protein